MINLPVPLIRALFITALYLLPSPPPMQAAEEAQTAPSAGKADSARRITGDPLFFVQDGENTAKSVLLCTPSAVPVLRSVDGETNYSSGRDFLWVPGSREVRLTPDSRIPFKKTAELYPAEGTPHSYRERRGGKSWMLYGEGRYFQDLQCVAEYDTMEKWTPPVPAAAPEEQLGKLRARLRSGHPLKLVTLGDSISTGANASGPSGAPPHQPGYPDLVAQGLEKRYGVKVTAVNLSVGGMAAPWGVEQIPAVLAEAPDLVLCAFGMNDASGRTPAEAFAGHIREIKNRVQAERPDCAVVLLSPMTANPEWSYSAPELYPAYATALGGLPGPGCTLADVTTVWSAVLERKPWHCLGGNGLNHPNDFGHRLYADTVLAVIGDPPKGKQ